MKKSIYSLTITALIAGMVMTACNNDNKKDDADKTASIDTTPGQTAVVAKTKTKLDKNKVPKEVTTLFYSDYPAANINDDNWYGYPAFDYANDWYNYDPDLYINDNPDAYVVQFTMDSIRRSAVYSKSGGKIAVHKMVLMLPSAVSAAISKGDYKTWTQSKDKEEIFKDKDMDKIKVYKVTESMGDQKHILYFESNGKLIKDAKVS